MPTAISPELRWELDTVPREQNRLILVFSLNTKRYSSSPGIYGKLKTKQLYSTDCFPRGSERVSPSIPDFGICHVIVQNTTFVHFNVTVFVVTSG
jgi:hypothetical protein